MWLFVGFCVSDSNGSVASIIQRSHIKSCSSVCFIRLEILSILGNRHIRIISYVILESFILVINLDVVSYSNVFNILIFVFIYKGITVLN